MPRKEKATLVPSPAGGVIVQPQQADSLAAWIQLYGAVEAGANADNTIAAKGNDLRLFLAFFQEATHSDDPNQWTRPVTAAFLKRLEKVLKEKPATVNRRLETLRHCARWIHKHRPFLAGVPTDGISNLAEDEPDWQGLTAVEDMRLQSAAEQLLTLKKRRQQQPLRDYALFFTLRYTALRVSELVRLDRRQYAGKHFHDVQRKGKVRTKKLFVPAEACEPLERYLQTAPDQGQGAPLFQTRTGQPIARQHVDTALRQIAAQANSKLPPEEHIQLSAHILRHTRLRELAREHGVEFAQKIAGHTSSRYIFRYVQPSDEEMERRLGG